MRRKIRYAFLVATLFLMEPFGLFVNAQPVKPIEITFWHSMAGQWGQALNKIVDDFNGSQHQYLVKARYKGTYPELLTTTVAAFRAHQPPAIVQMYDVATAIMLQPKGIILPVGALMKRYKMPFHGNKILPVLRRYYSDAKGQLAALPFNASTAVLFYNQKAFKKAGLNPKKPPLTWPQMAKMSKRLMAAGYPCGFSTAWPAWIQLESFALWHNRHFASHQNGFSGAALKLLLTQPLFQQHIQQLAVWQRSGIFRYGGRSDDAMALFTSGVCPILLESSGALVGLSKGVNFPVGVGPLPYWPKIKGAPQNTLVGGAALWVMTGHDDKTYRGVAAFMQYLMRPQVQAVWQAATGYLPMTKAGFLAAKKTGFYRKNPGALVALNTLTQNPPTPWTRGIRLGFYPQIRSLMDEYLEAVWGGKMSAKAALRVVKGRGEKWLFRWGEIVQH